MAFFINWNDSKKSSAAISNNIMGTISQMLSSILLIAKKVNKPPMIKYVIAVFKPHHPLKKTLLIALYLAEFLVVLMQEDRI